MPDLDRLEQLARMRDQGTLTQEEFLTAKQALLKPERRRPMGALVAVISGAIFVAAIALILFLSRNTSAPAVSAPTNSQGMAALTDSATSEQALKKPALDSSNQPLTEPGLIDQTAKFTKVGQCKETKVAVVGTRLEDTPGSGTAIQYLDGTNGFSYDTVSDAEGSRPGDKIKLCLVERPTDCPAGSDPEQGSVFSAENVRTGGRWSLPNSSHQCGGA